jgi:formate dehydrogenase subunit gamma
MYGIRVSRWAACLFFAWLAVALPSFSVAADGSAKEQAQRQQTQPLNNAPYWRDVRSGDVNPYQTTQVRGIETSVLVQTGGEIWRQIRNGPVTVYGGLFLIAIMVVVALFHWWHGAIKLHGQPTGRRIPRFTDWERLVHWSTAISFVILAISGVVILFGKYVLLPVFGYTLFSWLAILSKNLHNFVGPLFIFCTLAMFVTYVKDNLWKSYDFKWFKNAGGMLGGEHVPSGKFNAGEKAWFWGGVFFLSLVVGVTGVVLDFPNFAQGRGTMQLMSVIHAVAAVIYIGIALGHIYMGSIGVESAYDSMRIRGGNGTVDEVWAKEHHEHWYNEVTSQSRAPGSAPSVATASAMKEGWKT